MKYFQLTAYTPYCGEELTEYLSAESEDELVTSGKVDDLIADCVSSFMDPSDYEDYGFESAEEWSEYYYEGSGVDIVEVSKKEFDKYASAHY